MTEPLPPAPNYSQPPQQAQPYANPAYGTVPYGPRTNTLAIVALILGLTVPLGGIICGHLALSQIKRTGEAGHGLATAGLILGYIFTSLIVLYIIGVVIFAIFAIGTSATAVLTS
jgi:Domain of unknown function (DUF4190)